MKHEFAGKQHYSLAVQFTQKTVMINKSSGDETMVYRGYIRNGKIELSENVELPEGAQVCVEVNGGINSSPGKNNKESLRQKLLRHAGTAHGLPADTARNLDHYLYGLPKQ